MADLLPHYCPIIKNDEVLIPAGRPCPNGCGWIACDGDLEKFAVKEARAALDLWGPWLRLGDAARETGIAFPTIAQAAREGRLPFLQIGRQKFVRTSAVRARLSTQRGRMTYTIVRKDILSGLWIPVPLKKGAIHTGLQFMRFSTRREAQAECDLRNSAERRAKKDS